MTESATAKNIDLLSHVRIVLVEPQGPLNVGSVCRAMKNFGLRHLAIVRPGCELGMEAEKMALTAKDLLHSAVITDTLPKAIAGSVLVLGTSNRRGEYHEPHVLVDEGMQIIGQQIPYGTVSIVFGREEWGLTIDDLRHCQGTIHIMTDPGFSSLNLAQAVLLIGYELFKHFGKPPELHNPHAEDPYEFPPTIEELDCVYQHLFNVLRRCQFLPKTNPDGLFQVVRAFIHRARAKRREVNLLHGIISNLDGFMKKYHLLPEEKQNSGAQDGIGKPKNLP